MLARIRNYIKDKIYESQFGKLYAEANYPSISIVWTQVRYPTLRGVVWYSASYRMEFCEGAGARRMGFCVAAHAIQRGRAGKIVKIGEKRAYRTLRVHSEIGSVPDRSSDPTGVEETWIAGTSPFRPRHRGANHAMPGEATPLGITGEWARASLGTAIHGDRGNDRGDP